MQGGRTKRAGQTGKGVADRPALKGAMSALLACLALSLGVSAPAQAAGAGFMHAPWATAQRELNDSDYATPDRSSSEARAAAAASALFSARPPTRPERYRFAATAQETTRDSAMPATAASGPDSALSDNLVSNKAWNEAVRGVAKEIPETADLAPKLLVNENGPDTWVDARTGAAISASAPAAIARQRALDAARIPQAGGAQANVYWADAPSSAITASSTTAPLAASPADRPAAAAGRPETASAPPAPALNDASALSENDARDSVEEGLTLAERQAVSAGTPQEENIQEPRPFIQLALGRALGRSAAPEPVAAGKIDTIAKANAWPLYGAAWPVALLRFDDSSQNKPGWVWARVVSPIRGNWPVGTPVELKVAPSFSAAGQKGPFLALMSPVADDSTQTQSRAALLAYAAQGNAFNALRVQRWAAQGEARNAGAQWSLAMAGLLGMVALFCVGPRNRTMTVQRARLGLSCALMGVWSALSYLVARDAAMPGASDILLLLPPLVFCVFCAFVFVVRWPRQSARAL